MGFFKKKTPYFSEAVESKPAYDKLSANYEKRKGAVIAKRRFSNEMFNNQSTAQQISSMFGNFANRAIQSRRQNIIYARDIRRPLVGSGRKKPIGSGRGRPKGPSGKYYIPGHGPVGVYEYRMYLRAQLRERKLAAYRNSTLTPEQQRALAELQARQQAQQRNPENQVIPDTGGNTPVGNFHKEADDAANIIP